MIIFIGSEEKGFFVEDVGRVRLQEETVYVNQETDIKEQVNEILAYGRCSYMVFDIEQYHNSAQELTEEIRKLENTNNAEVVIFAPGYSGKSEIIMCLKAIGVKYFITDVTLAEQKDIFEKCLNGYYEKNNLGAEFSADKEEKEKKEERVQFQGRFIGVAGACHRIGTTTQAIQITKYLISKGFKACYIQLHTSDFWKEIYEWYNCSFIDMELGLIQFENVDIFYKQEKLHEVLLRDYDYFIYDFGVFTDPEFNKISFFEKHIQIIVAGFFPTEMSQTKRILENEFYKDVQYIFSFIEESEQKELMEELKGFRIYFSDDVRDPFVLKNTDIYEKIIPLKEKGIQNRLSNKKKKIKKKEERSNGRSGSIKKILGHYFSS